MPELYLKWRVLLWLSGACPRELGTDPAPTPTRLPPTTMTLALTGPSPCSHISKTLKKQNQLTTQTHCFGENKYKLNIDILVPFVVFCPFIAITPSAPCKLSLIRSKVGKESFISTT